MPVLRGDPTLKAAGKANTPPSLCPALVKQCPPRLRCSGPDLGRGEHPVDQGSLLTAAPGFAVPSMVGHCVTSLVVQWLRLRTPNARDLGSIPDQGTRSRMLQLKILHAPTEIPYASTEIWCSQIFFFFFIFKKLKERAGHCDFTARQEDTRECSDFILQSSKGSPAGCSGTRSPEYLPLPLRDDAGRGGCCQKQESSVLLLYQDKKKKKTIRCRKKKKGRGEIGSRTRFSLK